MSIRKRCPFCGNMVRMRKSGTFYNHTKKANSGLVLHVVTTDNKCPGSRVTPETAREVLKLSETSQ